MICSKCKIFSIHLPNFDSYICEFGHVFCRSCSPKPYSRCSICNGRIVRRAELLIEGVPKTIFHQTPNEDCNQISDAESEIKLQIDSDSDENWSRIFEYRDSEDYPENVACSPRGYACEIMTSKIDAGNCEFPRMVTSNQDNRDEYICEQLKQRRSNCQFKSPSCESVKIEASSHIRDDPKNLYMQTLCGDVSPDFDPKKDYFERVAQVNTIHEYYKRPNLLMATKSSSKVEIRMGDSNLSDSSTVIQHLTEFRKATNYVPPTNVSAYKVNNNETMSEPAIITTSKTRLPIRNGPREIFPPCKKDATSNAIKKKTEIQASIEDSRNVGALNGELKKVDVGTMMDICLSPSVNPPAKTNNHPDYDVRQGLGQDQINDAVTSKEATVNLVTPKLREGIEETEKTCTHSLRSMLREQLRNQVYSQFDCTPKKPQNAFMIKGGYSPNDNLPPRSIQVAAIPKVSKLSDAINTEVEKALKNLTTFPKLQYNGSQRREEIVKQSKNLLRQRIMDEVYSRFEKCQSGQHSCVIDTDVTVQENSVDILEQKEVQEGIFVNSDQQKTFASSIEDDLYQQVDQNSKIHEVISREPFIPQDKRSVGMSTESYPKLNPDLNLILPSKCSTQKSYSFYCPEKPIDIIDQSVLKQTNTQMPFSCNNSEKDVVDEILQQFQKNVAVTSCQKMFTAEGPQEMETNEYERVLRIDQLSPNVIYGRNEAQQTTFSNLDAEINGGTPLIDDNRNFEEPTFQSPGDGHLQTEAQHQNVYFFQQRQPFSYASPSPMHPLITSIGDDYNVNMKTVARNLMDDFREEPKNNKSTGILDINKFIMFIKEKFPKISLKQLKEIILNIPTDEGDVEELNDIPIWFPPPATFRSDYEKLEGQANLSENQQTEQTTIGFLSSDYPTEFSLSTVITAWRAYFCPPIDLYAEPIPQLKPVSRFDTEVSIIDHLPKGVKAAAELNLSRNPIICPVTTCSKLIFVSEFSKHIKMDHVKIPVETLAPGRCKNLFLDPRIDEYGINKCHILYLVTEKIRDLGSKEFKDYLPLLVMATRVSLLQLISPLYNPIGEEVQGSQQSYLMIWMTGLSPQDLPIYFSLTAWHRYSTTPRCHIVHSGRIYSIRNKHDDRSVFNSGNAMLLSQNQIQLLTNNGQDMIELQIIVH